MRILVACDSFKDALDAQGVCRAVAAGLRVQAPQAQIIQMPLSDGGEGLLAVLRGPQGWSAATADVVDPLGRPMRGDYGLTADGRTAIVESAAVSGLQLLTPAERNPLNTTTLGTGQLLAAARDRGAREAVLAIGGSATNDGGIGAATAFGWRFLDRAGDPVPATGGGLERIAAIKPAPPPFERLQVLCDVDNRLHGPAGAALMFGAQKGAGEDELARLDAGLRNLARCVERDLGLALADRPGAGAAGGLGYGAMAFLGGELRRGVEVVLDLLDFDTAVAACDLVVTGEGRIDGQTAQGKLIQGVCARAAAHGTPVVALAGVVAASPEDIRRIGLRAAYPINAELRPLAEMLARTAENLERAAAVLPL